VASAVEYKSETMSTLRFAERAKMVKNAAKVRGRQRGRNGASEGGREGWRKGETRGRRG